MQPIIVLTDFSAPATHAMLYAGGIASRLKAPMVLLNVYDFPLPPAAEPSTLVMPYEELLEQSQQELEQAATNLREKYPDLQLSLKSLMGDVARMSNELAEEESPFLIVIGSRKKHEGDLFGNTTGDVVTHSKYPVLSIPEHNGLMAPKIALLATDLSPIGEGLAERLREIVRALQLELHVVHVTQKDSGESHEIFMKDFSGLSTKFKLVISDDLSEGLGHYSKEIKADMVISLPHNRSWLEGLFMKKHTKDLVRELHLPLLCIPE